MANPDTPFGLRPTMHLNGNPWNGGTFKCYTSSGDATAAIFLGDIVDIVGDSCVKGCCMSVLKASSLADAAELAGVMVSCDPYVNSSTNAGIHPEEYGGSTLSTAKYRLAKEDRFVNCVLDPNVIYLCQGDTVTTSAVGNACDNFTYIDGSGSTTTGLSGIEVDVSTIASDKSLGGWIWGIADMPDHDIGINDMYYVMINTSVWSGGTLGRTLGV